MSTPISIMEDEAMLKVLQDVDSIAAKHAHSGFSRRNFSLGVLNCFLIVFTFGRYPQHFWLLCLLELVLLLPMRMHVDFTAKPNRILYYLDYCWMMNFIYITVLIGDLVYAFLGSNLDDSIRQQIFTTFYGVCCGPLLGAAVVLPFVAILFHDYKTMVGMFIHVFPLAIMYTFMWHSDAIREAWPNVLRLDYLEKVQFLPEGKFFIIPGTHLGTVAGNTLALYLAWLIPYVIWQLLIGIKLPAKVNKDGSPRVVNYDTVFHSTVRGGLCGVMGKVLWGRPASVSKKQMENDDYEVRDFAVYMTFHALGVYLATFFLAYPCHLNQNVHGTFLALLTVLIVSRGAQRYTYYVTSMYGRTLRKDFAAQLAAAEEADKNKKK